MSRETLGRLFIVAKFAAPWAGCAALCAGFAGVVPALPSRPDLGAALVYLLLAGCVGLLYVAQWRGRLGWHLSEPVPLPKELDLARELALIRWWDTPEGMTARDWEEAECAFVDAVYELHGPGYARMGHYHVKKTGARASIEVRLVDHDIGPMISVHVWHDGAGSHALVRPENACAMVDAALVPFYAAESDKP